MEQNNVCPKCKGKVLMVEYSRNHPCHYDGVSEYACQNALGEEKTCDYRIGRFCGKKLSLYEYETPSCTGKSHLAVMGFKKRFDGYWRGEAIPDEICFWWLSKIHSREERMKEAIEGMKKKVPPQDFPAGNGLDYSIARSHWQSKYEEITGYNSALDEALTLFPNTDVR